MVIDMGNPLFERKLALDGEETVNLQIFEPRLKEDGWRCEYVLQWPNKPDRHFTSHGIDKLQSLLNCLFSAESFLVSRRESVSGRLSWHGDQNLGLTISLPD